MSDRSRTGSLYRQPGLTAICAAGLFSVLYLVKGLYPFGNGSIMMTDLYSQYVPLLYRFYDVVTGQKNLFLDFRVSGGINLYVDTINEVINPFNYVLLLFGRDRIYLAVNALLLLYVTAAAASANLFLLKLWPGQRKWNVILSLCYALSGYTAYNFQIIKWMYFPVLFPLFALSLRRLLQKGKGGFYGILLAYQLALSIQLGFMTLLFTLFSSGIFFFTLEKKENRPAAMLRLGVYTLAGVLLSGGVLVPNVFVLLNSSRAGENLSYFGVMKRHGLDDLFERLFQIAHPVLLALAGYLAAGRMRRDGKREGGRDGKERMRRDGKPRFGSLKSLGKGLPSPGRFWIFLNGFLWLTVLLEPANLLWHMGSYVCFPVRYAYMVLLCEIGLVKWLLSEREKCAEKRLLPEREECAEKRLLSEKEESAEEAAAEGRDVLPGEARGRRLWSRGIAWGGAAACCFLALLLTFRWEERIVQAFSSLAISRTCPKETGMVAGICFLLLAAGLWALLCRKGQSGRLLLVTLCCGLCLNVFWFLPQNNGVRMENEASYREMVQQKPGGILDRVREEQGMPLNAALVSRQSSLSGYFPTAGRQFQQTMEEMGYLVPWVATQAVGGTAVSEELLSCIAVFEKTAEELQIAAETVLERQEKMGELAAGEKVLSRFDSAQMSVDEDGAVRLRAEGTRTFYLDPGMTADCFRVFVNGEPLEIPEAASSYSPHRIVELGTFTEEEAVVLVTDQNGSALPTEGMEFASLNREAWDQALERMNRLETAELVIEEQKGQIRITCEKMGAGGTVFLPFAALPGWKCIVNGENVDIASVFGGFMGITARAGVNEIRLKFIPPGLAVGIVLTVCSAAALLCGAVLGCGRSKGRRAERLERAAYALYLGLIAAGLLAIYVIPAAGLFVYGIGKCVSKVVKR